MTERAQNADFRRKLQIFADSPLLLEIQAFGGRRKPQETADFRRKTADFCRKPEEPQIGVRHLRSITFSLALSVLGAIVESPIQESVCVCVCVCACMWRPPHSPHLSRTRTSSTMIFSASLRRAPLQLPQLLRSERGRRRRSPRSKWGLCGIAKSSCSVSWSALQQEGSGKKPW